MPRTACVPKRICDGARVALACATRLPSTLVIFQALTALLEAKDVCNVTLPSLCDAGISRNLAHLLIFTSLLLSALIPSRSSLRARGGVL